MGKKKDPLFPEFHRLIKEELLPTIAKDKNLTIAGSRDYLITHAYELESQEIVEEDKDLAQVTFKWGREYIPDIQTLKGIAKVACSLKSPHLNLEWGKDFFIATMQFSPSEAEALAGAIWKPISQNILDIIPHYPSKLIGREDHVEFLSRLLHPDEARNCLIIGGLGGIGKTKLVLTVAYNILQGQPKPYRLPIFHAMIFVSAKRNEITRNGSLSWLPEDAIQKNLVDIQKAMARVLGFSDYLNSEDVSNYTRIIKQKLQELELKRFRILLILDNFETILSNEEKIDIWNFIRYLPSNVRTVITTRDTSVLGQADIYLKRLSKEDSEQLIEEISKSSQRLETMRYTNKDIDKIYARTQGNPAAIIYTLGELASGKQIEDLNESFTSEEDIPQFIFSEMIQDLKVNSPTGYDLLRALSLFPQSANRYTLAVIIDNRNTREIDTAFAQLMNRFLVIREANNRYAMDALTREYAFAELECDEKFESEIRQRLINWAKEFSADNGGLDLGNDWHIRYRNLAEEWETLRSILDWCINQNSPKWYSTIKDIYRNVTHYLFINGLWRDRLVLSAWLIEQARMRNDWEMLLEALMNHAHLLLQREPKQDGAKVLALLEEALALFDVSIPQHKLSNPTYIALYAELAEDLGEFYIAAPEYVDYSKAKQWLDRAEELANSLPVGINSMRRGAVREYTSGILALEQANKASDDPQSRQEFLSEAETHFLSLIEMCDPDGLLNWTRAIYYALSRLGEVALARHELKEARRYLDQARHEAAKHEDKRRSPYIKKALAELELLSGQGDHVKEACGWIEQAINEFELLGMFSEQQQLQELAETLRCASIE